MPPPHSHLRCLLLMMFVPLVSLAAPASSSLMEPHCADKEMACFTNAKCTQPGTNPDKIADTEADSLCDVHVEIRPYSTKKALIRLKTKDQKSIDVANKAESLPLFGCKKNGKEIQSIGTQKLIHSESLPSGGIACEFFYERDPLFEDNKKYTVQYGSSKIESARTNQFWASARDFVKCDLDWLANKFESDDAWIFTEPDKRFNNVVCKEGEELVYENGQDTVQVLIECKVDDAVPEGNPDHWKYEVTAKKDSARISWESGALAGKIGCRSKGCQKCATVPAKPATCDGCTVAEIKPDTDDGCNILSCPGKVNINAFDDAAADVIVGTPKCGAHGDDYSWLLNKKEVKAAGCTERVKCQLVNRLVLGTPAGKLDLGKNALKCGGEQLIQIETDNDEGEHLKTTRIDCNDKTGLWTTVEDKNVTAGSKLSCIEKEAAKDQPAGASLGTPETVAVAIVGVIIVAVIILLIFCFVYKPKKRAGAKKKLNTVTNSRQEDDTKTALPVGYRPPLSNTASDNQPTPIKVEITAELVEKTGISRTPEPPAKGPSVLMDTAILPATTPSEDQRDTKEVRASGHTEDQKDGKETKHRSQSDGSEPRSLKIGRDGQMIIADKKKKKSKKSGEEKSSKSEAGATTRKEEKPVKPEETGPKPRVFALDAKEEKIRRGATVKNTDYPTLAEIDSDWDDYDHAKALAAGNADAGKKKRGKTTDKTKTVPTAVTPEVPPSIERTQATNTRHTQDNADPADMENLVTQLDTTVEQKEADGKKK